MKSLMNKGIDINYEDKDGNTAIMKAAEGGHIDIIRMLLLGRKDKVLSLLYLYKNQKRTSDNDIAQYLIRDDYIHLDDRATMNAARGGHTEIVRILLSLDGYFDYELFYNNMNDEVDTPLKVAYENGHTETVKLLLETEVFSDMDLVIAARKGKTEIVKSLLDLDAEIDHREKFGIFEEYHHGINETALTEAAKNGHTEIVQLLLDRGASIDLEGDDNYTALEWAIKNENIEAAKLLLDRGAKRRSNIWDNLMENSLEVAVKKDYIKMTEFLLDCGVDKGIALLRASMNGALKTVEVLLDRGVDVNFQGGDNYHGFTPLMLAVMYCRVKIIKLLLDRGADLNIKNDYGDTAMKYAGKEMKNIIAFLVEMRRRNMGEMVKIV
ncbi:ankyrin [Piromyces finnis]|uniref:Ankyrin n=1 Tax=Piromyces finnis TaxID=1754191 RepID=A0A1Y1UW52_9FUNG|nr:ankyrin [Piromyces finnis]|eukprot:ORX41842.1 ankyrin [Piromyces finnis]